MASKNVCIIGAGPSGMSALFNFAKLDKMPDVICYERQSSWGGQWNYTWRTALDEYGEPCHSSMYKDLWTNAPKEISLEYPDYPFEQHFRKPIPSYPPVSAIRDYLEGVYIGHVAITVKPVNKDHPKERQQKVYLEKWSFFGGRWKNTSKRDLQKYIRFNTIVRHVSFQDDKDNFLVVTENLKNRETKEEEFTHVIVCNGIFNVPNMPNFPGFEEFSGRIMHSHDFRNAEQFKGQRILIIGSSYSAEDVAIHCLKFGAKHIIISWRSKPPGLQWPKGIEERPLVTNLRKNQVFFKDGTQADVDTIICCTGYKNHYPFLESRLRIDEETSFYPGGLYKSSLFLKAGNKKLFYIGAQEQLYTFSLFENIAMWVCRYIMETIPGEPVSETEMEKYAKEMQTRASLMTSHQDIIDFTTEIMKDFASITGITFDSENVVSYINQWLKLRLQEYKDYRSHCFPCIYTGTMSPKQVPFMEAFDDSLEAFLKNN